MCRFYTRWKEWESWYSQSFGLHFSLREEQWQEDWAFILSLASQVGTRGRSNAGRGSHSCKYCVCSVTSALLWCSASQPGSSLEQTHIFVLAHILRRPIIVYGVKYYKSFRGETLGYTRFQGEPSCSQSAAPFQTARTSLPESTGSIAHISDITAAHITYLLGFSYAF